MARSDVEERVAEKCLAWKHKNDPARPKDTNFLRNFGPLQSAMYEIRTVPDGNMYTAWR